MAPDEDPDEERPLGGQPLPPDDRLWRHPSELGPTSGGLHDHPIDSGGLAGPGGLADIAYAPPERTSTRSVLTGACLAGALVALGILMLTRPMPEEDVRRSVGVQTMRTVASTIPTFAAPAMAAAPIQQLGTATFGAVPTRPGRVGIEVTDDGGAPTIVSVEADGPAHRAGLEVGDVIVAVNGVQVADASGLTAALTTTAPADVVTIEVIRRGASATAPVALG